jgi:uncharacterized membrane protein YhiD involved in acid resistance
MAGLRTNALVAVGSSRFVAFSTMVGEGDPTHIPDTPKVEVKAQAVSTTGNDTLLEQIVGRLSLEPYVTAAIWRIDRSIPDG